MGMTIQKIRVVNPNRPNGATRKAAARGSKRKRQGNPNPVLVTLGFSNPQPKKGRSMKPKKAKKNPHSRPKSAGRRPKMPKRNPHRPRKRNPSFSGKGGLTETLKGGVYALIGLVVTRQIPQMLLGTRNSGALGYGANLATMFGVGMIVEKFTSSKEAGSAAMIGGGLYTVNRALQDYMSPVGKVLSLSGLGDAMALGEILTGDRTYMPLPVAYDNNRNPIIPEQIRPRPLPMAAAALPAATMGAYRRRRVSM